MTLALAGLLLLAPLWAWHIGAGWPASLRDNALKTVAWAGVPILATICWPLAILWGLALWHWQDPHDAEYPDLQPPIAGVCAIGTMVGVFLLSAHIPSRDLDWLRGGVLAAGIIQIAILGYQASILLRMEKRHTFHFWRDSLRGSMGNRTVTGAFLAFCFALAPLPLMPVFGVGVLATNSFTAWGAASLALLIRYPETVWLWLPVVGIGLATVGIWRGNPLDSIMGRENIWLLCAYSWWIDTWKGKLVGHGHFIFTRRARWWHAQGLVHDIYSQAHQDPLQFLLEYGAVGLGAVLILCGMLTRGMAWGDPWTAALTVGLVISCNQFTLHLPHTGIPVVVAAGVLWGRL